MTHTFFGGQKVIFKLDLGYEPEGHLGYLGKALSVIEGRSMFTRDETERLYCRLESFNQILRIGFRIHDIKYRKNIVSSFRKLDYI